MSDMTHSSVFHDPWIEKSVSRGSEKYLCVSRLYHMCDMMQLYVCHDSCIDTGVSAGCEVYECVS